MPRKLLAEDWRRCGLVGGDTALIHSSLMRTLTSYRRQGLGVTPLTVLTSFLDAVGPFGTLLFPLFNFDFTEGIPFDIRNTPSHMGALTEAARMYPGSVRTGHPIYSFAVIGANAPRFLEVDNFSGYGADSPFGLLRELNGKIAVLDLPDQDSMTFYHHIEEMHSVPYRYHKTFTGNYTDIKGITSTRTYGLFVRDLEQGVLTHVNPMGELLWEAGLYTGDRAHEHSGLRVIEANAMYAFVSAIISSEKAYGLLYIREGVTIHQDSAIP